MQRQSKDKLGIIRCQAMQSQTVGTMNRYKNPKGGQNRERKPPDAISNDDGPEDA